MTHFEREMMLHLDGLYAFALTLARRPDDAEDLVSDTISRGRWSGRTSARWSVPRARGCSRFCTATSRLFRGRRMLQRTLIRYAVDMGDVKPQAA